ncbi:metal-dependent hydrolase [Agromyces soli]
MTLPEASTRVTYPAGDLVATATVLHVEPAGDGLVAVVADTTSFHPVDASWPDQPADAGVLRAAGRGLAIRDAVVAAHDGTTLHLGSDIPVRKGTEGWVFVVAHLVDADGAPAEGDAVEIEADASLRRDLSAGHTACHLASLALNRALADRWSKAAREDALGSPDFDGTAIQSSRIHERGSVDRYRLNKSLRRAGFDTASLVPDSLDELAGAVGATLASWRDADGAVRIEREGDRLTDRRSWVCELPEGTARIACGGTHEASVAALGEVGVAFSLDDDAGTPVLVMTTTAHPES